VPGALRSEALTRLGAVRRAAGDAKGSVAAFGRAWAEYRRDPEALRFLAYAVDGVVPGKERWSEIWQQVVFEVDRANPTRPRFVVRWPSPVSTEPRPRYSGVPVTFDLDDGDILTVFRIISDVTQFNVVVFPGLHGRATYKA